MARKRSPGKDSGSFEAEGGQGGGPGGFRGKVSGFFFGFLDQVLQIVKFVLGLCLLPIVYCFTAGFLRVFESLDASLRIDFWAGTLTLVLLHLFIWEPAVFYERGQKIVEVLFRFAQAFLKIAPSVIPINTILVFVIYGIIMLFNKSPWNARYLFFFAGFSVAAHLVYSARAVQTKKNDFLKAHYFFTFSFIYLVALIILAGLINLWFKEFSFLKFLSWSGNRALDFFTAVFRQIFL